MTSLVVKKIALRMGGHLNNGRDIWLSGGKNESGGRGYLW
jgi:hypothetical protein